MDNSKNRIYELIVDENSKNERLDKYLSRHINELSREQLKNLILEGKVMVNQQVITQPRFAVNPANSITVAVEMTTSSCIEAYDLPLDVVYDDQYLAVINKPAGLTVHPGAGVHGKTLVNALIAKYRGQLSSLGGEARPGIVHRLDKDTSGLILIAKDDLTHSKLAQALAAREIKRSYWALCYGAFERRDGTITTNIARSLRDRTRMAVVKGGGRHAITHYQVKGIIREHLTEIEFQLETGRTHQIRLHMEFIKHPIVGDGVYGRGQNFNLQNFDPELRQQIKSFPRQALHAVRLAFVHPHSGEYIELESKLAPDIEELLRRLTSS